MNPLLNQHNLIPNKKRNAIFILTITLFMLQVFPLLATAKGPTPIGASPEFLTYWKSGLAEISSYEIVEERYGEMRAAQGVLVFVYEEINADSRIKVESENTPLEKQVPVLKLNNVLKFTTGIYDYSVMTSIFAGISGPGVLRFLQPQKVSFTSQEWCGNVFHQLIPGKKGVMSEIHSYFEKEGDVKIILPYPNGTFHYEDELPILIRELDGPLLAMGDSLRTSMLPGLWERRKRHDALSFAPATLTKLKSENWVHKGKSLNSVTWVLRFHEVTTYFHVEAAMPHKLWGWENSRGESAKLLESVRKPYWMLNGNKDLNQRSVLKLEYGMHEANGKPAINR